MKLLITGGKGMIGQAIAKKHEACKDEVYIYDNSINPYGKAKYGIQRDILDFRADVVSIQASLVSAGDSMVNPYRYLANNVGHIASIIDYMFLCPPKLVIFAGSSGEYGEGMRKCIECKWRGVIKLRTEIVPLCPQCQNETRYVKNTEDQQLAPTNYYAVSKLAQEEALRVFAQTTGIPVISLRYFSVYSGVENLNNPYVGIITVIRRMARDGQVLLYEDGLQLRDLVHCDDCAEAHYLFSRLKPTNVFTPINIGTGRATSLRAICDLLGVVPAFRGVVRPGDSRDIVANLSTVKKLGWYPSIRLEDKIHV